MLVKCVYRSSGARYDFAVGMGNGLDSVFQRDTADVWDEVRHVA